MIIVTKYFFDLTKSNCDYSVLQSPSIDSAFTSIPSALHQALCLPSFLSVVSVTHATIALVSAIAPTGLLSCHGIVLSCSAVDTGQQSHLLDHGDTFWTAESPSRPRRHLLDHRVTFRTAESPSGPQSHLLDHRVTWTAVTF